MSENVEVRSQRSGLVLIVAIALLALVGAAAVLWVTRDGIGLSPDSRGYLQAARNLAAGRGPLIPDGSGRLVLQTHLAPGYAAILSTFQKTLGDTLAPARMFNAALWVLNISLLSMIAYRTTGRSRVAALVAGGLATLSVPMLQTHVMLWSEPTFIAGLLVTLLALGRHVTKPTIGTLIIASLATALALMCRYAGASVVLLGGLTLLLLTNAPFVLRLLQAFVFSALSCGPMLAWIVYGKLKTGGNAANRELAWKGLPGMDKWLEGASTLGGMTLPTSGNAIIYGIGAAVSLGVIAIALLGWRGGRRATESTDVSLAPAWLFVFVYPLFIVFSISFFDALTPMDVRILSPWHVALIGACVGSIAARRDHRDWRKAGVALSGAVLVLQAIGAAGWIRSGQDKLAFAAPSWKHSQMLAWLRTLPTETHVYADRPEAVELWIDGQFAKPLPRTMNPSTKKKFTPADYDKALSGIRIDLGLRPESGVIVFFTPGVAAKKNLVEPKQLAADLGLEVVKDFGKDGIAYGPTPRTRELALDRYEGDLRYAGLSAADVPTTQPVPGKRVP
ncbi:MAG: hypothetical protein QM770_02355 [Tepidisphaeraceae bacterium]